MASSNKKSSTADDESTDTDELDSGKDPSDVNDSELLTTNNASVKHRV